MIARYNFQVSAGQQLKRKKLDRFKLQTSSKAWSEITLSFLMALFAFSQASPSCWGWEGWWREKRWGGMMFVQCNVGNAETFQGTGIFQQISWLIQVDKEELRRLGEALEMGQNRAVSKICLICGRKWRNWYVCWFSWTCFTPLPSLSRKEPFMNETW